MATRNYGLVHSLGELKTLVDKLLADNQPVGLDIETGYEGLDRAHAAVHPQEAFIVGISFTNSLDWARYVPMRHYYETCNLDEAEVAAIMWPLLNSGLVVAHSAKFELSFLVPWLIEHLGIDVVGKDPFQILSCTQTEVGCIEAHDLGFLPLSPGDKLTYIASVYAKAGLKDMVLQIFGHQMVKIEELFPGISDTKKKMIRFNVLELSSMVVDYACEDALWALAMHKRHYPMVKDNFIYKLEMQVLYVVYEMEKFGIYFDWGFMRDVSAQAKEFKDIQLVEIQDTFSEMLGEPVSINLNSSKQVSELLYDRLGFVTTRYTKGSKDTDNPKMSTDAIALEGLAKKHPVIKKLLEWKEVSKLIGSYLDKYERDFGYDPNEGCTHPSHFQTFVISGRFSVSSPGYQQLPGGNKSYDEGPLAGKKMTRYEAGDEFFEFCFRDAVICPKDYYAVGFDYSQAELRVIASEANETSLLEAFANGEDIHAKTASMMLGIPMSQVGKQERQIGKTMNFALAYQMGIQSLSERLAISFDEAQRLYDLYFETYPRIKAYIEKCMDIGRKNGYSVTKFGRKMTIWEYFDTESKYAQGKAGRMAFNTIIQGSATGDVTKIAMVRAAKAIKKAGFEDKVHLVMNIHDALEFYVHESVSLQEVCDLLEPAVVFPVEGWTKFVADWHTWERWGSCKEIKKYNDGKWALAA